MKWHPDGNIGGGPGPHLKRNSGRERETECEKAWDRLEVYMLGFHQEKLRTTLLSTLKSGRHKVERHMITIQVTNFFFFSF